MKQDQNIPTVDQMNKIWELQVKQERKRRRVLKDNSLQGRQLKQEMQKLHLVNKKTGKTRALISLKCSGCNKQHPKTPAVFLWLKLEMDKDRLKCPYCGSKNFVRTDSKKPQGELMAELIERDAKLLNEKLADEIN